MIKLRIKKVINNNILCVIDEKNHELIVTGKGLGFQRKTGEFIDPARVEKSYRMEDKNLSDEELVYLTIHLKRINMGV